MKKILTSKNTYINLLLSLLVCFPLIEVYRSFFGDTVQLFGLAAEEVLVILWAGVVFLAAAVFAIAEKKRKTVLITGAYFAAALIYLVLHGLHILSFDTAVFPAAKPDFAIECYYLVRMYLLPAALGASVFLLGVPYRKFLKAAKITVLIISVLIVVPDLFGVSFAAYADGNVTVQGSFFSWFSLPDDTKFALYTAKGFFPSANAVGILLLALAPLLATDAMRSGKWQNYGILFLQMLAMVMLGTKVAAFGFLLASLAAAVGVAVDIITKKLPKSTLLRMAWLLPVILIWAGLLLFSPGYKMQKNNYIEKENSFRDTASVSDISHIVAAGEEKEHIYTEKEIAEMEAYMEAKHYYHYIDPWFLEIYPVRGDMEFWTMIVTRDNTLNQSNRQFKITLIERIMERNGNKSDSLFGIGYTSAVPYTERDYCFQYYLYGAVGMILFILPFFVILSFSCVKMLIRLFRKKPIASLAAGIVGVVAYLGVAYFAGHVFDTLINMYFLSALSAVLLSSALSERAENDGE